VCRLNRDPEEHIDLKNPELRTHKKAWEIFPYNVLAAIVSTFAGWDHKVRTLSSSFIRDDLLCFV